MDTAAVIESIFLTRLSGYFIISSSVFLMCDYIGFLSDEINYIWPAKWNFGKVLYFLIRYPVFFDTVLTITQIFDLTPNQRLEVGIARTYLNHFGVEIVEAMLFLRTWIIWDRNKRIANILVTAYLFSFTTMGILVVLSSEGQRYQDRSILFSASGKKGFFVYLSETILAGQETLIVALTIVKALQDRKFYGPQRQTSLASVLYRDALINYVYIIILMNVVFLTVFQVASLQVALMCWQRIAHATLGTHTLLHIRKANELGSTTETISTLVFCRPAARVESQSRSIVERARNDMEEWLAPDPQLYPSVRRAIPLTSEEEIEAQPSEKQSSPLA